MKRGRHINDFVISTISWLKEWKLRADREERRKQQEIKQDDDDSNGEKPFKGLNYKCSLNHCF